jgi:hypothetical protein
MKVTAFWDIAPYSLVEVNRRFRRTYCLHHQDDEFKKMKSKLNYVISPEGTVIFKQDSVVHFLIRLVLKEPINDSYQWLNAF